jgi:hypothetical protein
MEGAQGSQHRPAQLIMQNLDFNRAEPGKFLATLKGGFLGAPEAAEGHFGVWLTQAPSHLSAREILDIKRLRPWIAQRRQVIGRLDVETDC